MTGIALETAQEILNLWIEAEKRVANGQAYSINGRSLTRVNAQEITDKINHWRTQVDRIKRGGIRAFRPVMAEIR